MIISTDRVSCSKLFMKTLIFIFIKVSSMGERFHIHSSEMEDKKTEMTNIFKGMGETLSLKIDQNDEKLATMEDLTLMNQEEMTNNLKNIFVKLNEFRSFQDNIYEEIMEHTRLMHEKNITSSNSYTEEKIKPACTIDRDSRSIAILGVILMLLLREQITTFWRVYHLCTYKRCKKNAMSRLLSHFFAT